MSTETFNWVAAYMRMREGKFVARQAWVELDAYIWYMPAAKVPTSWCKEPHLKRLAEHNGGFIECLDAIRMKTADGKVMTGWVPDRVDSSAWDWVEVHP
jgi:hypothetical protein